MLMAGIGSIDGNDQKVWWVHLAFEVVSSDVDNKSAELDKQDRLLSPPRWTGGGYYEAVVRDPDGNRMEIVAGSRKARER
jgi:lactoylglutathione lyase